MWQIPLDTAYSFNKDDHGIVVWAIQRNLFSLDYILTEDGTYGFETEAQVARFQEDEGLYVDGIFGPESSERVAKKLQGTVTLKLPKRLLEGFVAGESGGHIGAVNWAVVGGVDVSYLQRRVLDGADDAAIQRGFDGHYQFQLIARTTKDRYKAFLARAGQHSSQISHITSQNERAWRLAALAHNWPYAADRLSRGYYLSDDLASWVPEGTKFKDGTPVETYWDWARFYAIGAPGHQDPGMVTKFVRDWTP